MGSSQSVRASHFQRSTNEGAMQSDSLQDSDNSSEEHHISISNKMVERLVEDATLVGGAAAAVASTVGTKPPRGDFKEKIFIEKLKSLDDTHTERSGLTMEEMNALAKRIEMRTDNVLSFEPVCADCAEMVIECYNNTSPEEAIKCWDTVGAFSKCVQDATATRLRARTQQEERETARRSRHMQLAREHALKDLGPAPQEAAAT